MLWKTKKKQGGESDRDAQCGESADIVVFTKGGLAGFDDKVTFLPRLGGG